MTLKKMVRAGSSLLSEMPVNFPHTRSYGQ